MKTDWGKKLDCVTCGTVFYDMKKKDVTCPSCGQKVKPIDTRKKRKEPAKTDEAEIENELKNNEKFDFVTDTFEENEDSTEDIQTIDKLI